VQKSDLYLPGRWSSRSQPQYLLGAVDYVAEGRWTTEAQSRIAFLLLKLLDEEQNTTNCSFLRACGRHFEVVGQSPACTSTSGKVSVGGGPTPLCWI